MLNLKNNLYFAGVLALCILAACSSEAPSTAGSTTIPNASAQNDSIIFEGDKPIIPGLTDLCYANQGSNTLCGAYLDTSFYEKIVTFNTESTSLSSYVDSLDIKVYSKEKGASATCSVGDQSFDAKFMISSSYILKRLTMHNVGTACDSILHDFQKTCNTNPKIKVNGGYKGFCTSMGDLYAFCADFSYTTTECSEAGPDGSQKCHIKLDPAKGLDENNIIQEFVQKSESVCSDMTAGKFEYYSSSSESPLYFFTPGHNPVDYLSSSSVGAVIDTSSFTLEKYEERFAEPGKEYKFDKHVLAYRVLPSNEAVIDTNSINGLTIKVASPAEIAKYFPMTSAIAGENFNPEFCKVYTITTSWGYLSEATILTNLGYGLYSSTVEFALIFAGGKCQKDSIGFAEIFLVKDCDGVIYEDSQLGGDFFDSPWMCDENGIPPGRENGPYGEWYRADIAK